MTFFIHEKIHWIFQSPSGLYLLFELIATQNLLFMPHSKYGSCIREDEGNIEEYRYKGIYADVNWKDVRMYFHPSDVIIQDRCRHQGFLRIHCFT